MNERHCVCFLDPDDAAQRCNPLNMHSHRNLALALEQLGRKDEALAMFEQEVRMVMHERGSNYVFLLL